MTKDLPKSVVFITGTFIGNNCRGEWKTYFESKGYNCIVPAWPYKDAPPEQLRNRHPDPAIASNRLDYKDGNSIAGYKEFKSQGHLVFDTPACRKKRNIFFNGCNKVNN